MMKNRFLFAAVVALLACAMFAAPTSADIVGLFDWALNIDGAITYPNDPLPDIVDDDAFDFSTGLGTLTVTIAAPGDHFVGLFVDHEMDEAINTFFNESGTVTGAPGGGQTWEIDEPGYVFGDIYDNIIDGTLDNTNAVPAGSEDDVSMAMAWDFTVEAGSPLTVEFILSDMMPLDGFYLTHYDPDSDASIYFSSAVVPLPGAALLGILGLGVAGRGVGRFRRRRV